MATTPFSVAFEYNLKQELQGGKLFILKQTVVHPEFFCCISGNTVGVAKDPVPIISVPDIVVCIGDDVVVDYSRSWSPTSSLAGTAWTMNYGDGTIQNGNFPNPRNPAVETDTYVGGYAAVGFYTITFSCVDILGATNSTSLQVYAIDCTVPLPSLPFLLPYQYASRSGVCVAAAGTDVYYTEDYDAAAPDWEGLDIADIAPTECHDLKFHMTSTGQEMLYLCDFNGIYSHPLPPGGDTWSAVLQTADQIVTAAGLVAANYSTSLLKLTISMEREGWQWVSWRAAGSFPASGGYVGVAHTQDAWATIEYSRIVDSEASVPFGTADARIWGVCVDQHSNGRTVYCATSTSDGGGAPPGGIMETTLWRSADAGSTWAQEDQQPDITTWYPDVFVSYADGDYVYWITGNQLRSNSGGLVYAKLGDLAGGVPAWQVSTIRLVYASPINADIANVSEPTRLWEWETGVGLTQILASTSTQTSAIRERDSAGNMQTWLRDYGVAGVDLEEVAPGPVQTDKTGDWVWGIVYTIATPEMGDFSGYS